MIRIASRTRHNSSAYLESTQPLPGTYSRLPEGWEAQPAAIRAETSRSNRQIFDMEKF